MLAWGTLNQRPLAQHKLKHVFKYGVIEQYTDKKHSRSITEHYIRDNVSQLFHRVEWGLRYGGYMLENTLGGSKEREWRARGGHICLWWHILVWEEDFAICSLSCSCEDMRSGAGDMTRALILSCSSAVSITLVLFHPHTYSCTAANTHTYIRCHILICTGQTF